MPDHIHLFIDLYPSVSLSGLVKDIKISSSYDLMGLNLMKNIYGK